MTTPTRFGSSRRTAPHNGRSNAAKRAATAAKKKRATFLSAMALVTPYRKNLERINRERKQAFNNTVRNIISRTNRNTIMYDRQHRRQPLGLTQQQWYALAGTMITIHKHPKVKLINSLNPIRNRVRATKGHYTNENRNALIAWARSQ
jgi:hypothetical protein